MDPTVIVAIVIVFAIILFFAGKILSKTIRFAANILIIVILILAVLTLLVYNDLNDIKRSFLEKNNSFILQEAGTVYAGVTIPPINGTVFGSDTFSYFTHTELQTFAEELGTGFSLEGSERFFTLSPGAVDGNYTLADTGLDQHDLLEVLKSDDPYGVLAEKVKDNYEMPVSRLKPELRKIYGDDESLKGYLFAALLINTFQAQDMSIVNSIKSGEITVYPETIAIKVLKILPGSG